MLNTSDRLPVVTSIDDGNYSGAKLYVVLTEADANSYYLLAYSTSQAEAMATQIATDLSETISTEVALAPVYIMTGTQFVTP